MVSKRSVRGAARQTGEASRDRQDLRVEVSGYKRWKRFVRDLKVLA
jgi:hypothetical protein